jgi:hypothetical protein
MTGLQRLNIPPHHFMKGVECEGWMPKYTRILDHVQPDQQTPQRRIDDYG